MTISGSSVHSDIKEKISEEENKVEELESKIYTCETKIENLGTERENIYTKLATTYLPELEAKTVRETLHGVQAEVEKIFKEKQEKRQDLEKLMSSSQEEKRKFEKTLNEVTDSLNQKVAERDKLRGEVAKELSSNSEYTELDKNAKQAEERLKGNKERVGEIETLAKEKLPAYEKNRLFMYLVKRKFRTKNYDKRGLIARLDSWVAGLINFASQKANYDFLKAMPELMAQEVSRRQGELDKVVEELEKIEKNVSDKYGLTKIIEQGEALASERNEIIQETDKKDLEYQKYAQERKTLDSTKDPYHIEAVQELKKYLKGESVQQLKQRARGTPRTEDDRLVGRLEEIDLEIRELKDKTKNIKLDRNKEEKKLEGLREIESTYRKRDYDSRRSYFDSSFDINSLLIGYLAGKYSHDCFMDEMKTSHHFKPLETYHSSSSYSSSYHSSESSGISFGGGGGGGFGGGGFSGGGGFGGGGFSSGRGF